MSDTENSPTAPADNVALPGPHPHESSDFVDWRGVDETGVRTPAGAPSEPDGPTDTDEPAPTA
jgi:hypothetical protein